MGKIWCVGRFWTILIRPNTSWKEQNSLPKKKSMSGSLIWRAINCRVASTAELQCIPTEGAVYILIARSLTSCVEVHARPTRCHRYRLSDEHTTSDTTLGCDGPSQLFASAYTTHAGFSWMSYSYNSGSSVKAASYMKHNRIMFPENSSPPTTVI